MTVTAVHKPTWYPQGACVDEDPDPFYQPEIVGNERRAKRICHGCPVVDLCLETAIAVTGDDWGVWGGSTPTERERMRHARQATQLRLMRRHGHPSIGAT